MKVIEHLERADRPPISFEIIPPLRGGNVSSLMQLIDELVKHKPPFIDITSHPAEVIYEETASGFQRKIKRKRPGTLGVCALVQNKYDIDAVPHVLCTGFTKQETEDFLIELHYLGIDNLLALRGDQGAFKKPTTEGRKANRHAVDLIEQLAAMNRGEYLEDLLDAHPTKFCIGTSAYPEKHFEAPNLITDIRHTKKKVDAGAEYLVTQMFFNNQHYHDFVAQCRAEGIEVPIIPGLKILSLKRHLRSIPGTFHCEIPSALSEEIEAAKPEHVLDIGVEWAVKQAEDLLNRGVPSVHFYVMQSSKAVSRVLAKLDV
ncbi:MAG: methylenetetrahydrofolate reductase [Acidobacteriota bacterium]